MSEKINTVYQMNGTIRLDLRIHEGTSPHDPFSLQRPLSLPISRYFGLQLYFTT